LFCSIYIYLIYYVDLRPLITSLVSSYVDLRPLITSLVSSYVDLRPLITSLVSSYVDFKEVIRGRKSTYEDTKEVIRGRKSTHEDTKEVIRGRKSTKDRQYNDHKKRDRTGKRGCERCNYLNSFQISLKDESFKVNVKCFRNHSTIYSSRN
jgi:hypothetical protein